MPAARQLLLAGAFVLGIGLGPHLADAASRPPLPDKTVERLANGIIASLSDNDGEVGRFALSALGRMAVSAADGFRHGGPIVERILAMDGVQAAIRQHVRSHFHTNHRAYNLILGLLPALSDLIAEEVSAPPNPADDSFQTIDTALRSMRSS